MPLMTGTVADAPILSMASCFSTRAMMQLLYLLSTATPSSRVSLLLKPPSETP